MGLSRKVATIGLAVVAAGALTAAMAASAADRDQVLSACAKNSSGDLHLVAPGATCPANSHLVQWNVAGPPGPAGADGAPGPQGPVGPAGAVTPVDTTCDVALDPGQPTVTVAEVAGIAGDSDYKPAKGQIDLTGVAFCAQAPMQLTGSGAVSGRVTVSDVTVTKRLDSASSPLLQSALTNRMIPHVRISVYVESAGVPVAIQTLLIEDVRVTQVRQRAHGERPTELVSFAFRRLTQTTRTIGADGTPGAPITVEYEPRAAA